MSNLGFIGPRIIGRPVGVSLPNTAACQQVVNAAAAAGCGHSGLVRVLERLASHEIGTI